jgi:hypothetical protein
MIRLIVTALLGAMFMAGVLYLLLGSPTASSHLCDRYVDALLHSKDPLEVQRAGIIVHEVSCSITRRAGDLQ